MMDPKFASMQNKFLQMYFVYIFHFAQSYGNISYTINNRRNLANCIEGFIFNVILILTIG